MKILITGASGFIGSAFLNHISEKKYDLQVTLLSSSEKSDKRSILYKRECGNFIFNINETFDIVLHIGAWTPKMQSESDNISLSFSNISFTEKLLSELTGKTKRFIFISTLDVYSTENFKTINENSTIKPISLYGYSKLYCEQMISCWGKQNNISTCILRLGHIYGEGESAYKKMIPIFITNALNGDDISIYSQGNEKRSFLYIKDCVEYIAQAVNRFEINGIYNIVSGISYSVKDIAFLICKIIGNNTNVNIIGKDIPTRDLVFDIEKLKQDFDVNETDFILGLKREINYFKNA